MKIKYQFTHETVEIDVDDSWGNILIDLDRQEYNSNQTETRRHLFLDGMDYEGEIFAQEEAEFDAIFDEENRFEKLQKAIAMLKPEHMKLVKAIFFEGMSVSKYAAKHGVSQSAISQRLNTVIKKLKKLL